MRGLIRYAIMAAASGMLMTGLCTTAFGAVKNETRIPIESVSIQVHSDVRADYDIEEATVYTTTGRDEYTIGAYTWVSNKKDYWEPGDVPKVQIELHAKNGYFFNRVTGAGKFQISGATYSSVKRKNNNETLLLTVKLTPAAGVLDEPEDVEWLGYPTGKATWSEVPFAGAYELKLFREGQLVQEVPKVNALTYDFYPLMKQTGSYQFRVRAIPKDTAEQGYITPGDWTNSDEQQISIDEVYGQSAGSSQTLTPDQLGWMKDSDGWWYRNTDGTYPADAWQLIDSKWYLFGNGGYILTGWQSKNGIYYYLDGNGVMQTGWIQENRKWYYLNESGALMTGWLNLNGAVYYLNSDGSQHTGWLLDNGKWYYLSPDNGMLVRNAYVGGYYLNEEGIWQ